MCTIEQKVQEGGKRTGGQDAWAQSRRGWCLVQPFPRTNEVREAEPGWSGGEELALNGAGCWGPLQGPARGAGLRERVSGKPAGSLATALLGNSKLPSGLQSGQHTRGLHLCHYLLRVLNNKSCILVKMVSSLVRRNLPAFKPCSISLVSTACCYLTHPFHQNWLGAVAGVRSRVFSSGPGVRLLSGTSLKGRFGKGALPEKPWLQAAASWDASIGG